MKKVLRIGAGVGLVLVGIVGLIMPIMPGWIFLIPGLVILGEHSPRIRRLVDWLRAKFEEARNVAMPKAAPTSESSSTEPPPTMPSATMEDRSGPGH